MHCVLLAINQQPLVLSHLTTLIESCAARVEIVSQHAESYREFTRRRIDESVLAILPATADDRLVGLVSASADDFLFSPIRDAEFLHRLSRLIESRRSIDFSVEERLVIDTGMGQLLGSDSAFLTAIQDLPLLAKTDAPVLITGETGTGKDLCAHAIHYLSARRTSPFVPVDCGAVPDHLFENELFGHVRGAFTDAHVEQKGLIGMANSGTLFIDEIDSMSPTTQAKLLRFLQDRSYKPLGADRFLQADVRMVAATNQDMESLVANKRFRPDLYFRLNVLRIHLPPLRERRSDIPMLAANFVDALSHGKVERRLSANAIRKLTLYDWPGNVRELYNVIQRAVLLSGGTYIQPGDIRLPVASLVESPPSSFRFARAEAIAVFERSYVEGLLREYNGNVTRAAQQAGKERRAFGRLVKKYKIDRVPKLR